MSDLRELSKELREKNNLITEKQYRLEELRSRLTSMSVPTQERVQTSPCDFLSNLICEIVTIENELNDMIDEYSRLKNEAKEKIFCLNTQEWQDIVYMHSIEFKTFREIAVKKGLSTNAVKQKYKRATKYMKKYLTDTHILC